MLIIGSDVPWEPCPSPSPIREPLLLCHLASPRATPTSVSCCSPGSVFSEAPCCASLMASTRTRPAGDPTAAWARSGDALRAAPPPAQDPRPPRPHHRPPRGVARRAPGTLPRAEPPRRPPPPPSPAGFGLWPPPPPSGPPPPACTPTSPAAAIAP